MNIRFFYRAMTLIFFAAATLMPACAPQPPRNDNFPAMVSTPAPAQEQENALQIQGLANSLLIYN